MINAYYNSLDRAKLTRPGKRPTDCAEYIGPVPPVTVGPAFR